MEAKFGGQAYHHHHHLYGPVVSDLRTVGEKSTLGWDLNDWRWDGDLLTATPVDCGARRFVDLSNSSSSNSEEFERGGLPRDLEKRRRGAVVEEEEEEDEGECLRLGGQAFQISGREVKCGKKSKVAVVVSGPSSNTSSSRAVCQVEDCRADLSNAKDYHRRHKVCEVHSKASKALIGNIMQRFCQQCSRYKLNDKAL